MNELYFNGWGYFKTSEKNADKALDKLMEVLSNTDLDFTFEKVELRDENGELYFNGWGYFKTHEKSANKALDKLMEVLSKTDLDFTFEKIELRDENGDKIDD